MPHLLGPGSLPRAPRVHPAQETARPRRGIQIGWGRGAGSSCRFPGGTAREKGASCHLQLRASVSLVGTEITPSPGRAGRGVGEVGRESQARRGRDSGFLPTRQHPGDTGAPSGRYPACVDSCAPSGEVPRRSLRLSADTGFWAALSPGASSPGGLDAEPDRAPPTRGTQAASPKLSEPSVPGRPGP